MSFNASGTFTIDTPSNPVVADTDINPTVHNATMTEIAAGLSNAICRDGQSTITQNIPFNSKKITGLGDAVLLTDACNVKNLVNQTGTYIATVGGTGDAITLTSPGSSPITQYVSGMLISFIAGATNTTAVTIDIDGLGAKSITKAGTIALTGSDIVSGMLVVIRYDGTRFQLQGPFYSEGSWTPSVGGNATYTAQTGRWTKIGRLCFIHCLITINVLGTGSTSTISGLPFTAISGLGDQALSVCDFSSLATSVVWIGARVNSAAATVTLRNITAASASATSSALFGNGASVEFSGFYMTA